jgi:hypothetical protein
MAVDEAVNKVGEAVGSSAIDSYLQLALPKTYGRTTRIQGLGPYDARPSTAFAVVSGMRCDVLCKKPQLIFSMLSWEPCKPK